MKQGRFEMQGAEVTGRGFQGDSRVTLDTGKMLGHTQNWGRLGKEGAQKEWSAGWGRGAGCSNVSNDWVRVLRWGQASALEMDTEESRHLIHMQPWE